MSQVKISQQESGQSTVFAPEMRIEEGDVVVLLGSEAAVAAAEIKLLQG